MKKYIQFVLLIGLGMFLSRCEEVIEVDLNEANPQLVIEANLNVGLDELVVNLSRTGSYFDNDQPVRVNDAVVTLSVNGNAIPVPNEGNGIYRLPVTVMPSQRVRLDVVDGGETHFAEEIVPTPVPIDSLSTEFFEPNSFFDGGTLVSINFQEPGGEKNFIRVKIIRNGELLDAPDDIIVEEDILSDGQYVNYPMFGYFYDVGEDVQVIMESIPGAAFEYYSTLVDITVSQGGGSTAAPANPNTNIQGGALGLFNVFIADTASIIIPTP